MYQLNDLMLLLKSSQPLIHVQTHEEQRAVEMLQECGDRLERRVLKWSVTKGLVSAKSGHPLLSFEEPRDEPVSGKEADPADLLREIQRTARGAIYVLCDFHPWLNDPVVVRLLKEIAQGHAASHDYLVLVSSEIEIPDELNRFTALFTITLPDRAMMRKLILREAREWRRQRNHQHLQMDREAVELLASNLTGLTVAEARRLIRNAIHDDDAILMSDLERVQKAKYELLAKEGLLQFEYETASLDQVGGLATLKEWLGVRKEVFLAAGREAVLDKPKGILLVGVQGGGKSLAARAVAGAFGVPLLRLDFGALYNKFFGETERNIREALGVADLMSPCVLWIDEIEKGIATDTSDTGTSQRLLATLLTWMAEKESTVFIVATANKIDALPPELIRKGRLDEIFFVDLPDEAVRGEIFAIHLNKRDLNADNYDLGDLARRTEGFSGAEIEQVVVSALYQAFAQRGGVTMAMLQEQIEKTRPLSVVMAEAVAQLRSWADGRTVRAN